MNSIFHRVAEFLHRADSNRIRRIIVGGVILVGALLRWEYLREYAASPLFPLALGPDIAEYDARAREILNSGWLGSQPDLHAPLYSFFLALQYQLSGFSIPIVRGLQSLINWAAWIGFYQFRRRRAAPRDLTPEIFLAIAMLYPAAIFHQAELISESLLLPVLLLTVALLEKNDEATTLKTRLAGSATSGFAAGLAAIIHPTALFFAGIEALRYACLRRYTTAAIFTAALLLPILPVSWMQSRLAARPVLIQTNSVFNLYLGHNPDADGSCYLRPGSAWRQHHRDMAEKARNRGVSEDRLHLEQIGDFLLHHPGTELLLLARKALLIFSPLELPAGADGPALFYYTPLQRHGAVAGTVLLLIAALAGLYPTLSDYRQRTAQLHLLLLGGAFFATQLLTVTSGRYRLAMLPALFMLAAVYLQWPEKRWRQRILPALGGTLVVLASLAVTPERSQTRSEAVSLIGEALFRQNRPREAAALLTGNFEYSNDCARDANLLGEIHRSLNDHETAASWYRQAADNDPDDAYSLMNLGALALERNRLPEARQCFEAALHRNPLHVGAAYNLALTLERTGHTAAAEKAYLRVLQLDPQNRPALNSLGLLAFRRGDFPEAVRLFRAALALDPEHQGVLRNLHAAETAAAAENK